MTLLMGAFVDPSLKLQGGYFYVRFAVVGAQTTWNLWSGWTSNQFPVFGNIWLSMSWSVSTNAAGGNRGNFLYQPRLYFWVIPPGGGFTGDDEFAVAPEDHYFAIE
jgi:hypothetical protein